MSFVMMVFLLGLFSEELVFNLFKVNGGRGLFRVFISAVVEDLMWGG